MDTQLTFLILTFAISALGMLAFIVALIQKQVLVPPEAARAIFAEGEMGSSEPGFPLGDLSRQWKALDQSARGPINLHFWLASVGVLIYAVALGLGGVLQGLELRNPDGSFEASLKVTLPYLMARSAGGTLMLASHLLFAYNILDLLGSKERAA